MQLKKSSFYPCYKIWSKHWYKVIVSSYWYELNLNFNSGKIVQSPARNYTYMCGTLCRTCIPHSLLITEHCSLSVNSGRHPIVSIIYLVLRIKSQKFQSMTEREQDKWTLVIQILSTATEGRKNCSYWSLAKNKVYPETIKTAQGGNVKYKQAVCVCISADLSRSPLVWSSI